MLGKILKSIIRPKVKKEKTVKRTVQMEVLNHLEIYDPCKKYKNYIYTT